MISTSLSHSPWISTIDTAHASGSVAAEALWKRRPATSRTLPISANWPSILARNPNRTECSRHNIKPGNTPGRTTLARRLAYERTLPSMPSVFHGISADAAATRPTSPWNASSKESSTSFEKYLAFDDFPTRPGLLKTTTTKGSVTMFLGVRHESSH